MSYDMRSKQVLVGWALSTLAALILLADAFTMLFAPAKLAQPASLASAEHCSRSGSAAAHPNAGRVGKSSIGLGVAAAGPVRVRRSLLLNHVLNGDWSYPGWVMSDGGRRLPPNAGTSPLIGQFEEFTLYLVK
jgi:hypothetical protein